jgi:Glycosyl hydrolases family 18
MAFKYVNAWIELDEDEPIGMGYSAPESCFQRLIRNNVYQSVDILSLCFVLIVPTTTINTVYVEDGFTLQYDPTPKHPGGLNDIVYAHKVMVDAKLNNPNIRFLAMMLVGKTQISQIFADIPGERYEATATAFAKNAVAFLKGYGFHGFEIDWEGDLVSGTTQQQLRALAYALKREFGDAYIFVMNTASTTHLTGKMVNDTLAFLTLQLYAGWVHQSDYLALGIDKAKLAYGATFEDNEDKSRQQTPEDAYKKASEGGYEIVMQWRLNSRNFSQEQDGQVKLYALCKGK